MSKLTKCKICALSFEKQYPFQKWCSVECGVELGHLALEKKKAQAQAVERKETRERLDSMRKKPQLVKAAQTAFNAFIRARDAGKPCISCGKPPSKQANSTDAGHYRSVGSAPHMRFSPENCYSQCKHCNKYLAGNHVEYRKGLIERIGLEAVERIEGDTKVQNYTQDDLRQLAKHYRQEAARLKKGST